MPITCRGTMQPGNSSKCWMTANIYYEGGQSVGATSASSARTLANVNTAGFGTPQTITVVDSDPSNSSHAKVWELGLRMLVRPDIASKLSSRTRTDVILRHHDHVSFTVAGYDGQTHH